MLETRTLGSSGLDVTRIGLGMAALGRPGYINLGHGKDLNGKYQPEIMEAKAHAVLDAAWKAGVRYFDAARSYGRGEEFLGGWLNKNGVLPEDVSVGSKWGYTYTAAWEVEAEQHEVKEHSIEVLERQWHESRDTLGQHLDLYQIHSATLKSGVMENSAVLSRLAQMKSEGVAIGFSVSGDQQAAIIEKGLGIVVDGVPLFDAVQATLNILETSASSILKEAHERGVGVIIKEALANGRLTSRNDDPVFIQEFEVLQSQAHRLGTSIDAFALAGVLRWTFVDVALSGAAIIDHLESNLKAAEVIWDDEASDAVADLVEEPKAYWGIRGQLAWN